MCKCIRAFLSIKQLHFLPSVFSPFWGENFLVGPGRKHLSPNIYFPSFSPNQTHSKRVFLPIFSPKFSVHSISPPNKYTLEVNNHFIFRAFGIQECFLFIYKHYAFLQYSMQEKMSELSQIKDYDVNDIGVYLEAEEHLSVLYTIIRCKQLKKIEVNKQAED